MSAMKLFTIPEFALCPGISVAFAAGRFPGRPIRPVVPTAAGGNRSDDE